MAEKVCVSQIQTHLLVIGTWAALLNCRESRLKVAADSISAAFCLFIGSHEQTWLLKVYVFICRHPLSIFDKLSDHLVSFWLKRGRKYSLEEVSYTHTRCHCKHIWFIIYSCQKKAFILLNLFSCATEGLQNVLNVWGIIKFKKLAMKLCYTNEI